MAHIVSFKVSGLAGRSEPVDCKLARHVNIFYGVNGSGKTTLLKLLHSAMDNDAKIIQDSPFKSAEVTIHSNKLQLDFTRSISRHDPKTDPDIQQEGKSVFVGGRRVRPQRIQWKTNIDNEQVTRAPWYHRYLPITRLYETRPKPSPEWEEREVVVDLDDQFAEKVRELWVNYMSDALQDVRQAQEAGLASILGTVLTPPKKGRRPKALDPEIAYRSLSSFLDRQQASSKPKKHLSLGSYEAFFRRYQKSAQLRSVANDIYAVEKGIELALSYRDKLQEIISRLFSGNKTINLAEKAISIETKDKKDIGLQSLSSGEKHFLMIGIETISAGFSPIIIDEPEISMHVDWQHQLVGVLTSLNPRAQLILATHSPEVMAQTPESQIFRL